MIRKALIVLLLVSIAAPSAFAQITKDDIDRAIDKSKLRHPYLYFSEKDKPAIRERIANDPECRDIMNRLLAEANRLLYTPVETVIPIQGNNTRAGWTEYDTNGEFDDYFYTNRNSAFTWRSSTR